MKISLSSTVHGIDDPVMVDIPDDIFAVIGLLGRYSGCVTTGGDGGFKRYAYLDVFSHDGKDVIFFCPPVEQEELPKVLELWRDLGYPISTSPETSIAKLVEAGMRRGILHSDYQYTTG